MPMSLTLLNPRGIPTRVSASTPRLVFVSRCPRVRCPNASAEYRGEFEWFQSWASRCLASTEDALPSAGYCSWSLLCYSVLSQHPMKKKHCHRRNRKENVRNNTCTKGNFGKGMEPLKKPLVFLEKLFSRPLSLHIHNFSALAVMAGFFGW